MNIVEYIEGMRRIKGLSKEGMSRIMGLSKSGYDTMLRGDDCLVSKAIDMLEVMGCEVIVRERRKTVKEDEVRISR